MPFGDYLVGLAFFTCTVGAVGVAAGILVRRRLAGLAGAARVVALSLLVLAGVVVVHLVPAALGILDRVTVLVAALAAAAGASRLRAVPAEPESSPAPSHESGLASRVLAAAGVAAVALYALALLREHATVAVAHSDYVHFTMPEIAQWIRSGTVWENVEFIPRYAVGAYPNNGGVWLAAFVLPWKNDAFVRFAELPLLAVLGAATYALARELRAPAAPAALMAALVLAIRAVTIPAIDYVKPDSFMLAAFAGGALFLLRAFRTRGRADLVLAGVGLGLAFGARWYGPPFVAVLVAAWAIGSLLARRGRALVARQGLALTGLVAAFGGFWLVRNLAVTGNPLFPVKVKALGVTLFDAPPDVVRETTGFTVAGYLRRPDDFRTFIVPEWKAALGAPAVVLGVGALAALALGLALWRRRTAGARDAEVIALALLALVIGVTYLLLPGTAQGPRDHPYPGLVAANSRYLMPALVLAAPTAAWVAVRAGRARLAIEVVALAALGEGLLAHHRSAPGGVAPFHVSASSVGQVALALVALAAALLAVRAARRRLAGRDRRRALAAGVAALGVIAVVVAGQVDQRHFNDHRYRGSDASIDWILDHAASGNRVGVTGLWGPTLLGPTLPSFGPRFGNHVAFVGPIDRGMLRFYTRRDAFLTGVRRGRYSLLIVGRGLDPSGPPTREERWLRGAGFQTIVEGYRFKLMRPGRA